ncbi:MAG: leucine-rich repeat protein [Butyricicoccus sp.]|nr:leucine-rich repeat protein [Butyricicoccus sp.]
MNRKNRSGRTWMRMVLLFVFLFGMTVFSAAAEEVTGTCGDSVSWSYETETGALSITGTGDMAVYTSASKTPWYAYRTELKEVEIGSGVTSVAPYAFDGCSALAEVTLPEGLTAIGKYAFYNCTALTEIDLPESLVTIGNSSFQKSGLQSLTVPEQVTKVEFYAFADCAALESVDLPDGLAVLGDYMFQKSGLKSVTVPGSIASVSSNAFRDCTALETVILTDGVQKIGTSAFSGCTALETVSLPATLTEIGGSVFNKCTVLSTAVLPEGLTKIGANAFTDCEALTSITIPSTVTMMSTNVFKNAVTSITFADGIKTVPAYACHGANRLTSVTIPDTVTFLNSQSFYGCTALQSIDLPAGLTGISDSAFYGCTALKSIDLPEGLTRIGSNAFSGCTALETVTVPSTVTTMGSSIFKNGVRNVIFAEGMTKIPAYACCGADTLETVVIPASVTAIDAYAFEDCAALTGFTVNCDLSAAAVADTAFDGCIVTSTCGEHCTWSLDMEQKILTSSGKGEMVFETAGEAPWYPLRSRIAYLRGDEGVTTVADDAFAGLTDLRSAIIPDTVTAIGDRAFKGCTSLLRVELPKRLLTIGEDAFLGCDVLETMIFCSDRVDVDHAAIPDSSDVTIYIPESADSWEEEDAFADYEDVHIETFVVEEPLRDVVLVLDISSSMYGERIEGLKQAAQKLIDETGGRLTNTRFSIVTYSESATQLCDFSSDVVMLTDYLQKISTRSSTYMKKALTMAGNILYGSDADSRCLLLFTDGEPSDNESYILNEAAELRKDYNLYTIGLDTDSTTRQLLIDIAGNKERYFEAKDIDALITLFGSMADELGSGKGITQVTIVRGGEEYDLLNSLHTFRSGSDELVDILVDPEWGNAVRGTVQLVQGNRTILTDEYGNFRDIRPGRLFDPHLNIYVQLLDDDGYVIAERRVLLLVDIGLRTPDKSNLYYQVPEERLFRIHSYPNQAGFTVEVNGNEYISGQTGNWGTDDIDALIPKGYTGDITISQEGYHSYTFPSALTGAYNVITMRSSAYTDPYAYTLLMNKSQGAYTRFRNLLVENEYTNKPSVQDLLDQNYELESGYFYPMINWNGHGAGKVWLQQGDIRIELTENAWNVFVPAKEFEKQQDIYLCTEAADGTRSSQKIKLQIGQYETRFPFHFGDHGTADTSESEQEEMDIFGGKSVSLNLSSLSDGLVPISFTVEDDGTVKGVIGLRLAKASDCVAEYGNFKEAFQRIENAPDAGQPGSEAGKKLAKELDELKKDYAAEMPQSGSFGVSGEVQVLGYFTAGPTEDGFKLNEVRVALLFKGKAEYVYNTTIAFMPAYIKVQLGAEITTNLAMLERDGKLQPKDDQALNTKVKLGGEAGPGWEGYLSCGVYGEGALGIYSVWPIDFYEIMLSLQAELGVTGTIAGIEGQWKLLETAEKVFFDGGEFGWWDIEELQATMSFTPDLTYNEMMLARGEDAIADGVSAYAYPQLIGHSDGTLLAVWQADAPDRSALDKNALYYAVRDEDGEWSAPAMVWDDGTSDGLPQLKHIGGETWLIWQNYTEVFDSDSLPSTAEDGADAAYRTIMNQMDIAVSRFDPRTGKFADPQNLELDGYDRMPQLGLSEQTVTAAWHHGEDAYYLSEYADGAWSAPEKTNALPVWYEQETALPETYEGVWPSTSSPRQVLQYEENTMVLYTAENDSGITDAYAVISDGSGWDEPVQITHMTAGTVRGFRAAASDDTIRLLYTYDADNELTNGAALRFEEIPIGVDLTATEADYVRETLVPERDLTIKLYVKNNGLTTAYGGNVVVKNGNTVLTETTVDLALLPGQEELHYVPCPLPADLSDLGELTVSILPVSAEEQDESDNAAVCVLSKEDLSLEHMTVQQTADSTYTLVQVVNRGQSEIASTTLTFRKGAPDGEILGTQTVTGLAAGELVNLFCELPLLDAGEMVYVAASELDDENLIGNNSTQATVTVFETAALQVSAAGERENGRLVLDVTVDNESDAAVTAEVIAAAYDADTGRMLSSALISDSTIPMLNSVQKTIQLALSGADNVTWKVFTLAPDTNAPLLPAVSGTVK